MYCFEHSLDHYGVISNAVGFVYGSEDDIMETVFHRIDGKIVELDVDDVENEWYDDVAADYILYDNCVMA